MPRSVLSFFMIAAAASGVAGCASESKFDEAELRSAESCSDEWKTAVRTFEYNHKPLAYRSTLIRCADVADWESNRQASGAQVASGVASISALCTETLVSSPLCEEASGKAAASAMSPSQGNLSCFGLFTQLATAADKMALTNQLLSQLSPKISSPDMDTAIDFGAAVEDVCDPDGDGVGDSGMTVAQAAAQVYTRMRWRFDA